MQQCSVYDPKPGEPLSPAFCLFSTAGVAQSKQNGRDRIWLNLFLLQPDGGNDDKCLGGRKISSVVLPSQIAFRKHKHLSQSREITGIALLYLPPRNTGSSREMEATCITCQNLFPQHVDKSGRISHLSEVLKGA